MKSGTAGYDSWVHYLPILPAVRTLQRNVQHVTFAPGMLHCVFDMLEVLGRVMPNCERDCQIVLDEMQLEATPRYDSALKDKIGYATLPTHEGTANKALLFILAGIATRWKLSVRVEFTNHKEQMYQNDRSNPTGCAYKNIINEILVKTESVGLRVSNVTSDMGSDNLAFWRAYGVKANRKQVTSSFQNPVRPDAKVHLLPDVVHMMKNTKAMLESNRTVELPSDVVEELGLCSPIVDYKHIEELYEHKKDNELKVAFRLKESTVHTKKHFKKMNVGTDKSVICHRTGVGLKILAREKDDPTYETTAWLIMYLNTFFALATARDRGLAISKANMGAYDRAIQLIQRVSYIFSNMKIGQAGVWKPVQRGMVVLCHGYLQLIDYFLNDQKYAYLMLGRFTSDCIENMFSLIRLRQAVPNASLFLQNLKVITLAQYSSYVKKSSYDCDGSSAVSNVDFLKEARERALERANQRFAESLDELMTNPIDQVTEADFEMFDYLEKSVLYDIAGSQIAKIKTSDAVICDVCLSAVLWKGDNPHPDSLVTVVKEYDDTLREDTSQFLQICVSDQVYKAILTAEVTFRKYRDRALKLKSLDMKKYFVENLMYVWNGAEIPNCHGMSRKILNSYMDFRVEEHFKQLRQKIKETETIDRSSKSVAGQQASSQMLSTMYCR